MNVTLTLRRRILALISLALLVSIAAGIVLTYWHANKKVAVEMTAAIVSARSYVTDAVEPLVKAAEPSRQIQRIVSSFDGNRHLHAKWIGPAGHAVAESVLAAPDRPAPRWFYRIFAGDVQQIDVFLPKRVSDLGFIRLATDSHSEVGEVWEDLSLKMMIVASFAALILSLVHVGLTHALKPLTNLSVALTRVGDGDYTARVPVGGPEEFSRIYASFNAMAKRLFEIETQNSRLNQQLAKVQEEERADIARDLHDEFGPFLFSIDVDARSIQNKSRGTGLDALGSAADSIRMSVAHLQKHLRSILGRLRPSALLDLGLKHALNHLVEFWKLRQPDVAISLDVPQISYNQAIDDTCYRVVQEALNNAMKHGAPSRIEIRIQTHSDHVSVSVSDDGRGVLDVSKHGFGLSGMRERINAINGTLHYGNRAGANGFYVIAKLPLEADCSTSPARTLLASAPQVQL